MILFVSCRLGAFLCASLVLAKAILSQHFVRHFRCIYSFVFGIQSNRIYISITKISRAFKKAITWNEYKWEWTLRMKFIYKFFISCVSFICSMFEHFVWLEPVECQNEQKLSKKKLSIFCSSFDWSCSYSVLISSVLGFFSLHFRMYSTILAEMNFHQKQKRKTQQGKLDKWKASIILLIKNNVE